MPGKFGCNLGKDLAQGRIEFIERDPFQQRGNLHVSRLGRPLRCCQGGQPGLFRKEWLIGRQAQWLLADVRCLTGAQCRELGFDLLTGWLQRLPKSPESFLQRDRGGLAR